MDADSPTLEVGFEIDFGGSFSGLKTLDDLLGNTAADMVRDLKRVEQAVAGVGFTKPLSQVRTFGNSTSREMRTIAQETSRAEKAGEALVRQLDRQASTFGKSREEIQRMKVETAALAAEQSGLTELAGRLRTQQEALSTQQAQAAQRAAAAAEKEAAAVREAAFAHQMFEAKARQGIQAMRAQEAADRAAAASRADLAARTQRFIQAIDPAAAAQGRFNSEMAEARTLIGAGTITLDQYVAKLRQEQSALDATNAAIKRGVVTAGAHRQAMAGASYQVQDFITQVSMGANPINAFAVQGAQLAGQFQNMENRAGAVARFFMGPWGLALTAGAMIIGPLINRLTEQGEALDNVKFASSAVGDAQSILGNVIDIQTGKINNQSVALQGLAQAQLAVARVQAIGRQAAARSEVRAMQDANMKLGGGMGGGFYNYDAQPAAAKAISADVLAGKLASKEAIQRLENLNKAGAITNDVFVKSAAAVANFAVEGENLKVYDSAQRMLDGVGTALDRNVILKVPKATKAAKDARDEMEKLRKKTIGWINSTRMEAQGNVQKVAADIAERNKTQWADAEFAQARAYDLQAKGLKVGEQQLELDQRKEDTIAAQLAGQQQMLDYDLQRLYVMEQMGGIAGRGAGALSGLMTGDFGGLRGDMGKLLNAVTLTTGKEGWKAVTDKLDQVFGAGSAGSFAKVLQQTFAAGGIGSLAGSSILGSKNSELGSFAGGALGEKFGEKFLEKGLGKLGDFAGPLGSIVGGVLGGALGGLLQKAKWGTTVVTGQDKSNMATAGNKAAYSANAGLAGNSIQTGLQAIADQLGADIGGFNVSIGQYKDKWRVSTTGREGKLKGGSGRTDIKDFGVNGAEDAIKFAIADAISDGALLGLRASTQRLMQGGLDVEQQLAKALQFEGVFSELKSMTDPVGYAIEQLDKWQTTMKKTFAAAGASVEEYAQLQQLYDMKRIEALKEANAEAESLSRDRRTLEARILELQGNAVESVAMMRKIELEQMKDSLRPLQEQVWALEDAADAAAAAKQLRDAWQSVGDGIMDEVNRLRGITDGKGPNSFATLMGQFNATTAAARGGDQEAAARLAGISKSLSEAAELSATSRQELDRVKAMIAASLEATARMNTDKYGAVGAANRSSGMILTGGPEAATLAAAATAQAAAPPAPANDYADELAALREAVERLQASMERGQAAIASNTGKTARILDDVTGENGGQAITVSGRSAA